MEKDTITESMSKISSAVEEQNQILWENSAYVQAYTKRNEQLQEDIKKMQEEIKSADREISEIQPEIENLNFCYNSVLKTIQIKINSQYDLELFRDQQRLRLNDLQKKESDACKQYGKLYEETKAILQDSSKSYSELMGKRREVKKSQYNCRFWEKEIQEIREKNAMKLSIQQKIFYQDIVKFARIWLQQKEAEKSKEKFKALKIQGAVRKVVPHHNEDKPVSTSFVLPKVLDDVPNKDPQANIRSLLRTSSTLSQTPQLLTLTSKLKEIEMKTDCNKIRILDMQVIKPQVTKVKPKNYNTIVKNASQRVLEKLKRKHSFKNSLNKSINLSQSFEIVLSQPVKIPEEILSQEEPMEILSSQDQTQKSEEVLKKQTQEDNLSQSQSQTQQQPEKAIAPELICVSQETKETVKLVEDPSFVKPQDIQNTALVFPGSSVVDKDKSFSPQFNFGRGRFNFGSNFGKLEDKKEVSYFNQFRNLFGSNNDDGFQASFAMQNQPFEEMDYENANCSFKEMVSDDKDENEKVDINKSKDFQFGQSFLMNLFQ